MWEEILTDGFSRCHQVNIARKKTNTRFDIEWGSVTYDIMPFGFSNTPVIFSRIIVVAFK